MAKTICDESTQSGPAKHNTGRLREEWTPRNLEICFSSHKTGMPRLCWRPWTWPGRACCPAQMPTVSASVSKESFPRGRVDRKRVVSVFQVIQGILLHFTVPSLFASSFLLLLCDSAVNRLGFSFLGPCTVRVVSANARSTVTVTKSHERPKPRWPGTPHEPP